MRCPRCGNENPEENRFCGMCGATLLSAPPARPQAVATPVATTAAAAPAPAETAAARPPASEPPRTSASVSEATPLIGGPSFLGLNDPAPRKRASLSIDPHAPSSHNLDYLLEDEEQPRHSGAGKFVLIVISLALAAGLGYLRWKNQGFGSFGSIHKPSAAASNSSTTDTNSPAASSAPAPPAITPESQPPAATQPAAGAAQTAPNSAPAAGNAAATPAAGSTAPTAPPATSTPPPDASKSNTAATPAPDADNATPPPAKEPAPAAKQPVADTSATPADTSGQPKPVPTPPATKPHAATKPVVPVDPVAEAQKYIYGRGVPQDCDRGMRLLKPAANQSNPNAMVEMGALYSAGLCTPHDLPTAYRWFALALRKDPDNQAVQNDLQKLWGEMTQPERKLAIQLTQ